jgi:hypothetical protein
VPAFWENAAIAKKTRISTAINSASQPRDLTLHRPVKPESVRISRRAAVKNMKLCEQFAIL